MPRSWPVLLVVASVFSVACPSDDAGDDTMGGDTLGATSSAETVTTSDPPVGSVSAGADVYTQYCDATACHGPDGDSGLGPNLSFAISGRSDEALESVILLGVPASSMSPGMPGQALSDRELADLMAYLRWTF